MDTSQIIYFFKHVTISKNMSCIMRKKKRGGGRKPIMDNSNNLLLYFYIISPCNIHTFFPFFLF
jgi:hypothetical protein